MPTGVSLSDNLLRAELRKPMAEDSEGVSAPDNSEVRKIAEDVLNALQYSLAAAAANPDQTVRGGTVENDFRTALKTLDAPKRDRYRQKATELVTLPEAARMAMFGRYGKLDAKGILAIGFDRAHEGLPPLKIDTKLLGVPEPSITVPASLLRSTPDGLLLPSDVLPPGFEDFEEASTAAAALATKSEVLNDRLAEIWGPVYERDPYAAQGGSGDFEEQAVTDKLSFNITRVKCVDETNPEWFGHDEIAVGGLSVDETGDTLKISETYVGGGFDDGDSKSYSPAWRFHWFSLTEGSYWPKHYEIALAMAEKDHGGFASFLSDIWSKVKDKVKDAIQKAIAGGLSSLLGPAIAAAIGTAVAWIIDKLINWIIQLFGDDIFPVKRLSVNIPSYSARWNYSNGTWGSTTSPVREAHFYGHDGHYYVQYYWQLFA